MAQRRAHASNVMRGMPRVRTTRTRYFHSLLGPRHARLCPPYSLAMPSVVSYAQRFEDLYLLRCFGERRDGFYIDIGSGHPVYDNMSFAFYLQGWRGITVEPNPWLAAPHPGGAAARPAPGGGWSAPSPAKRPSTWWTISTGCRPRSRAMPRGADAVRQGLAGDHRADDDAARALRAATPRRRSISSRSTSRAPRRTCCWAATGRATGRRSWWRRRSRPTRWRRPGSDWEPFLARHGYRYVLFDSLNRYYLAEEASELAACFADRAGGVRRRRSVPQRQARPRRRDAIPTTGWRRCSPAPT